MAISIPHIHGVPYGVVFLAVVNCAKRLAGRVYDDVNLSISVSIRE